VTPAPAPVIPRLEAFGRCVENTLLVVTLVGMILLAGSQILLRNVFDTGFIWSDELLRLMVLWLAMIGAVVASRENKHIQIDVLSRFLPKGVRLAVQALTALFSSSVCGLIAWHALRFTMESRDFGDALLGNVPAWYFQAVLPLGFALVAYRYALLAVRSTAALLQRSADA
jgi:TRAP-type C4-dicarboxylate transport system permease small subunit